METSQTTQKKQRGLAVIVRNEADYKQLQKFLGSYLYIDWVPKMATNETSVIIYYDDINLYSIGSVGSTEHDELDGIRIVEFTDFFKSIAPATDSGKSELKHDPEPWNYDFRSDHIYSPGSAMAVAEIYNENNAERIVQCVNACAGIHDPSELIAGADIALIENVNLRYALATISEMVPATHSAKSELFDIAKKTAINALNGKNVEMFSRTQIEHLQDEVYQITGKGEVMQLFNKLLGVNAG